MSRTHISAAACDWLRQNGGVLTVRLPARRDAGRGDAGLTPACMGQV